jgi:hypothetical protein
MYLHVRESSYYIHVASDVCRTGNSKFQRIMQTTIATNIKSPLSLNCLIK